MNHDAVDRSSTTHREMNKTMCNETILNLFCHTARSLPVAVPPAASYSTLDDDSGVASSKSVFSQRY